MLTLTERQLKQVEIGLKRFGNRINMGNGSGFVQVNTFEHL